MYAKLFIFTSITFGIYYQGHRAIMRKREAQLARFEGVQEVQDTSKMSEDEVHYLAPGGDW